MSNDAPSRRSSWTWGLSRARRNSLSEAVSSLGGLRSGRNSLSAVDSKAAESLRGDVAAMIADTTTPPVPTRPRSGDEGGAQNNHRRSTDSRPPPAFYNRPYNHQRTNSAAAALQRHPTSGGNDEHLMLPSSRLRSSTLSGPVAAPIYTTVQYTGAPIYVISSPDGRPLVAAMPMPSFPPRGPDLALRTQRPVPIPQPLTSLRTSLPPRSDEYKPMVSLYPEQATSSRSSLPPSRNDGYRPMASPRPDVTGSRSSLPASKRDHKPTVPRYPDHATSTRSSLPASANDYKPMVSLYPDRSSMPSDRPGSNMKPRRLSNSSSSSSTASSIVWGRESFESRLRSSSLSSSQTSIESMPPLKASRPSSSSSHIHHQMGGYSWSRPAPVKLRQRKARPGELFSLLPGEVLELILQELRQLHLRPGSGSCETCWMRDCCSVAVSARKFVKYAREALYQHVHLVGPDSPQMKKRLRMNYGGRLVLLRRTLRANTHIAVIVRSLKPPVLPPGAALVEYNDLVASVVRACPNLERLVGYYPVYTHEFQRLFHALSTRKRLKEMSWVVETSPMQRQQKFRRPSSSHRPPSSHRPTSSHPLWAPGDLQPQQSQGFLDFHLGWQNLTTLVVHCQPEATITPDTLFSRAIRCLPSLQNLHLSHLPHTSFNDNSLLCLPPLKKLSLSHLPGITTSGISALATRVSSATITTLTLIHINVETLPALARLFAHLTSLETFSIVQCYAPIMPTDELVWLFPYLASHSLCKLHWDIPYLPTRATTADNILAKSISAGGFPALRVIRAPNDPEGIFQSLCRPRERIDSTIDRYRGGHDWHASGQTQGQTHGRSASGFVPSRPQSQSNSNTPPQTRPRSQSHSFFRSSSHTRNSSAATTPNAKSTGSPPTSPTHPPDAHALFLPRDNSDLHQARLAAQTRLEGARRFPRYFIQIVDEDGDVIEKHGVGAFIGNVRSNIHYVLTPEEGGTDEGGGLVGVAEMAGDCGEALVLGRKGDGEKERGRLRGKKEKVGEAMVDGESRTREGCQGRWNTSYGTQVVDKKDRERWAHTERGRWMGVALS